MNNSQELIDEFAIDTAERFADIAAELRLSSPKELGKVPRAPIFAPLSSGLECPSKSWRARRMG